MDIAVLIKQVPVSNAVSVDPETHTLIRGSTEGMINPTDLNAIEQAVLLKEQTGGRVVVFTMGPPDAEKSLRDALALGCDESCLVTDRCLGGGDTIATAKTLAQSIQKYGTFDLLLCGALSADGATGQVGAMTAEYLTIPHVSEISGLDYDDSSPGEIAVIKKYQHQEWHLRASLPALFTVCFGSNEPRLATLRSKRAAKSKPLAIYSNAELQLPVSEVGLSGSPTLVTDSFAPERNNQVEMLTGTDSEIANKIKELIKTEKGKN